MERLSISLADYASNGNGFGVGTQAAVDDLNKALQAGQITGRDTTDRFDASGSPLKVESLEKTLKHLTFRESDITFWKDIPKKPAYNTVVEYNQQSSYGRNHGAFNLEGELPEEADSVYTRRAQFVKYLGTTRSVTHQMTLVNSVVGNIIQQTIKDGTLWILRHLDEALFFGNSKTSGEIEFDGFLTQHQNADVWADRAEYFNSEHVIDMKGKPLTEEAIERSANTIVENYATPTTLYAPPSVLSGFVKQFYGNKFIMPNTAGLTNGVMGQHVQAFESQFGRIDLKQDVFFKKRAARTVNSEATSDKAPNVPTATATAVEAGAANSKWTTEDAGNVKYAVAAVNRYGESKLKIVDTAVTVVATGAADIAITDGGGTHKATSYRIYRTKKGDTNMFYPILDVSVDDVKRGLNGGSVNNVRDLNEIMPDTDQAMVMQFDNEVIEFAQLAPLMKMDLAMLAPAYRFMILLYGTPLLYAPKKLVRIINIGRLLS